MGCPTHEIHGIQSPTNKNDFTVLLVVVVVIVAVEFLFFNLFNRIMI